MKVIFEVIKKQIEYYPDMKVQDLLKAVYQSVFGCGHFVYDEEKCRELFFEELSAVGECRETLIEELGEYCRVHLSALKNSGVDPELVLRLFILSAKKEDRISQYIEILRELPQLCEQGLLPFDAEAMKNEIELHISEGCPSLHHSEYFREKYHPAYRVIKREYAELLPLMNEISGLLGEKAEPIIAIDGNCASGKSTLAGVLAQVFAADVIHMDDYFLPFEKRSAERLSEIGGNIDHERFLEELLLPLSRGEEYISRPYRCHGGYYEDPKRKKSCGLTIIEGSYSLHQGLEEYYDMKIFMYCDTEEQLSRLERRNPEMLGKFISTWIPLEKHYFDGSDIISRSDIIVQSKNEFKYEVKRNVEE